MMYSEAEQLADALQQIFPRGLCGIIFDCDGVMVDSCAVNIAYYNLLLREVGKAPVNEEQAVYVQMSTAQEALEYLFTPEEMKLLPAIAEQYPYRKVALPQLQLEPGLAELLAWLRGRGVRLGVHTNRGNGMWDLLDRFGLKDTFDPVMTAEQVPSKPDPAGVRRILKAWNTDSTTVGFVGDSSTDAEAARGGNVPLLAYGNPGLPAALHINDFRKLHEALQQFPRLGIACPSS